MRAIAFATLLLLGGCDLIAPKSPADRLETDLAALLERHNRALEGADLAAYQGTIDQERPAFRRCANETFEVAARSGRYRLPPFVVRRAETYGAYARAFIEENGSWRRLYFRKGAQGWVLSEPLEAELGTKQTRRVTVQDTLHYYESDSDLVEAVAFGIVGARSFVAKTAPSGTAESVDWRLLPTREVIGFLRCGFGGFAIGATEIHIHQVMYQPTLAAPDVYSQGIQKHELLHLAQEHTVPRTSYVAPWWAFEGWPEYLVQLDEGRLTTHCRSKLPTLQQLGRGVPDGGPDDTPENRWAYYDYAASIVGHVHQRYGANAYWDFLRAYSKFASPGVAYPAAFGVTPEAFYSDWSSRSRDC